MDDGTPLRRSSSRTSSSTARSSGAVAFGHERRSAAMVAIDLNTVGNWAERHGLAYTSYMDLSQKPEIRELIRDEIRKCNQTLPESRRSAASSC